MLAGALIVTNVPKAKQLVEKGQKTVTEKVKGLMKKEEMHPITMKNRKK